VNVTRTLRAAIDRITRAAPVAGAHLSCSIRTGTVCRYPARAGRPRPLAHLTGPAALALAGRVPQLTLMAVSSMTNEVWNS
jgi:hypothetical protein